jgi:L-fuculose-phosphate aldolase
VAGARDEAQASEQILAAIRELSALGLLPTTSGNLSVRTAADRVVVTPSGVMYTRMSADDLAIVSLDGTRLAGRYRPSSETPMHLGVYRRRDDVGAVVHTHSRYATALACLHQDIPPIHYMLTTICSDGRVPVAPYALYGTELLAERASSTLGRDRGACLLANHGVLTVAAKLATATDHAVTVEEVAAIYHHARALAEPVLLDDAQVNEVADKIADYGATLADEEATTGPT